MAKPQAASKAQQAAAVQSSKPAKQPLPNTPRGWMQRAKQAIAPKSQPAAPAAKPQPPVAPKAAAPARPAPPANPHGLPHLAKPRAAAPKQDPPEVWKPARSPKDLPPAGSNGIESKVVKNKLFGLGGREVHVTFTPPPRVPATERYKANGVPTQPAPVKPQGRIPATQRYAAKPKGTIFDNDRAAHARDNGLPAPKSLAGKSGPNRPGAGKSGPAKGGRGR